MDTLITAAAYSLIFIPVLAQCQLPPASGGDSIGVQALGTIKKEDGVPCHGGQRKGPGTFPKGSLR